MHSDEKLNAFVELRRQVLTATFYLESIALPASSQTRITDCYRPNLHDSPRLFALEKHLRLRSKTPRVRIKVLLLLLAMLPAVGCASHSARTEGKGTASSMPEVTVDAPAKKVEATIRF